MKKNINLNSLVFNLQKDKEGSSWIPWFIGFCDAEGNFQTFPKKRNYQTLNRESNYYNIGYGFHLSLSIRETELLYDIYRKLDLRGKIYEYEEKQEIRLAITKLEDLIWLIYNIFEKSNLSYNDHKYKLLTKHQNLQYTRLKLGVLNKFNRVETLTEYKEFISKKESLELVKFISSKSNKDMTKIIGFETLNDKNENDIETKYDLNLDNWIIGFINGEGSFHTHSKGHSVFYIEQSEKEVLNLIKKRLEFNPNVLFRKKRSEDYKDTYSLSISSKNDIKNLISFLDNPLLEGLKGYKKLQFKN